MCCVWLFALLLLWAVVEYLMEVYDVAPDVTNPNAMLSEHFSLQEMVRSNTARMLKVDNIPTMAQMDNLKRLCETVLEEIRAIWGCPIHVNSGFRCQQVNTAVRGKANSQHLQGLAADIVPGGLDIHRAYCLIRDCPEVKYDQLWIERNASGHEWIHVSIAPEGQTPRRQAGYIIERPAREIS